LTNDDGRLKKVMEEVEIKRNSIYFIPGDEEVVTPDTVGGLEKAKTALPPPFTELRLNAPAPAQGGVGEGYSWTHG
jgi:hypothetical protein